ncbi:phenol 2-monooxygenase P5 subunit [Sphaerotilus hippei]|uniref:Phenol 2-monooxygenase P5 subunit n=1 Tax=Sphaerotilus hippei TaxID=744406 RepID=A0A318GUY6_9BURK|nr:2Fe-2S iron-sulfur cluster binding domain-containing protein [Sphaerotilus hippei]PXW92297.1 phenol 2-monooxygenase P5 subunit [Sphaerotilus hippei]
MSYQLHLEPTGQTVEVDDDQTILDACLRAGVWLPHACCHGLCATCKVRVLDGEVEHGDASPFALMDFEREEGRTLACCARLQSDVVIEADLDEEPDALNLPVQDYRATVTRLERLTPTIRAVHLRLDRPMAFQAGQYVNLEIPSVEGRRAFSIASPPAQGQDLELHVRIVQGGAATTCIHERLQVGDTLALAGPYGRFFVRKSVHARDGRPLLFMAGGSGLSSPRSMILDLLQHEGRDWPITLVYGQRHRAELYEHEAFLALAERFPNFTYVSALSHEPEGSDWTGPRGWLHEVAARHFKGDFSGRKAYLCGPPAMIDACLDTLMQGRLFERDIHTEKFLSAADAQRVRSPLFRSV